VRDAVPAAGRSRWSGYGVLGAAFGVFITKHTAILVVRYKGVIEHARS
jgi:hypothetical protein